MSVKEAEVVQRILESDLFLFAAAAADWEIEKKIDKNLTNR